MSSFLQRAMFIVTLIVQNQQFQKSGFFQGFITTNDELALLTIKGKWLEAIVHMTEFEFLDLPHPKQVQHLNSIRIYGKIWLLTTFALINFQEKHPTIYPIKGDQFEMQRFNYSFGNYL